MTISLGQSQNLITNGDFESGDTAWSGAADYLVTANGNTYFSRTVANAGNPWEANLSRPMSITTPVGTGYTLTFQAWSTTGRTIIAGIGLNGGDYSNVNQTVTLTSTPKRFTLNFNTNFSSASSRILFDMGNVAGDVNIDNVVLSLTPTNLITNGDFESGDTGWTGATGNLVTTGDDATYYSTTVANAGNPWEVNLSRPVSITAAVGTSYQLSFQAWSNTGRTILAGIGLAGDPWTNQVQTVTLTSTPQTFFLDLTTNFSSASSRIIFDMGAAAGDVNIDNVVLSSAAATSTCNNGVQDGDETGVDCGGTCPACATVVNIEGKWKVTEIGVGPAKGSYAYFSLNVSSGARSCFFDDVYQFNADASFNFIPGTQTYREGWLGDGCGAAVAPFDGSNAATYTNSGSAITVTGTGAFIGLPKAINGAEIGDTASHPGTVTYQATSVTTTEMTLDIAVAGGNWWRYKLAKVDESLPIISDFPALEKALTAQPFDLATPTSNSAGAFTYTSSNEAVATISGATVTIVGAGTTTITATQAANGTFNTGSISAQLVVAYPAPAVAAPTPTKAAEDVISIFSNAYTDKVGTAFAPNWGQNPTYSQVNIAGNATNRYTNFSFVGNTFSAGGVDASAMQQLHLDIWTPDCTSFDVYVLDGSDEQKVTLTPTTSEWNSFDIDLSQYDLLTKSGIVEFKFANGGSGTKTIYLDNIYFWKTPSGFSNYYVDADSDGYGAGTVTVSATPIAGSVTNNTDCNDTNAAINPGATEIADGVDNDCDGKIDEGFPPSTAAPAPPARNAWDVKSIFSGAYSNVTLNEFPTSWSESTFEATTIASNATWKMDGTFLAMVTNYDNGVDLSQMTTMHIDYWTPDNNPIGIKLVNTTVNPVQAVITSLGTTVTGSWRSIDIPLSDYVGLDRSKITQILIDPDGVSTVYIDNFYFYRAETTIPAPVVANVTQCKGAPAVELTAATFPGYGLKWYAKSTDTAALATTPKTTSTTSGTKTSYVALYKIPDGTPGPKAAISVVTNTEVTPAVSSTLLLKNSSAATVTAVGPFIGTTTEFTLEAAASTTALASYKWTLPTGVNQVLGTTNGGINDRIITVTFDGSNLGTTGALPISVQSTNATGGCPSASKTLSLTRAIPAAPSSLKMNNGLNSTPITSFAKYMGTGTVLRLSAAVASTALYYVWELPEGVKRVTSLLDSTIVDDLESNSPEIFVTFTGVTNVDTATLVNTNVLRIGVKSKNAVGVSTTSNGTLANPSTASTAKLLTLSAVKPAAPSSLKMYDLAVSATAAVTAITTYLTTDTELKLEAKASALASSYTWVLYDGVNVTNGSADAVQGSPNTYTSISNSITVNFENVPHEGAFSLVLGVRAVNGIGESVSTNAAPNALRTDKLLTLTAVLPSVPGAVTGSLKICATTASSVTYTIAALAAKAVDYLIEVPEGCTITSLYPDGNVVTSTGIYSGTPAIANAYFTVNYPAGFVVTTANPKTITIKSANYVGQSATSKVLTLTNKNAVCGTRIAPEAATATEAFKVVAYPNPSSSEFTIETSAKGAINAKVYDMQGRLVENAKSNKVGSSLAPGIYNVIVSQGANTKSVRLIKK